MHENTREAKLIAHALYQVRLLLSGHLGSDCGSPTEVRAAAHLAYALHNEALAVLDDVSFDVDAALGKVKAMDGVLATDDGSALAKLLAAGPVQEE